MSREAAVHKGGDMRRPEGKFYQFLCAASQTPHLLEWHPQLCNAYIIKQGLNVYCFLTQKHTFLRKQSLLKNKGDQNETIVRHI